MNIQYVTPLVQVFDMAQSIEFYCGRLGFTVISSSETDFHWAMLRLGEATIMLNTAYEDVERPAKPDAARVAAHADTILYFGCDSVESVQAHLALQGVTFAEPQSTHYGMTQLYVTDPDGYQLCFQHATET